MKRCPLCHRVETDEALKFCRVDGVTLVTDRRLIGVRQQIETRMLRFFSRILVSQNSAAKAK